MRRIVTVFFLYFFWNALREDNVTMRRIVMVWFVFLLNGLREDNVRMRRIVTLCFFSSGSFMGR